MTRSIRCYGGLRDHTPVRVVGAAGGDRSALSLSRESVGEHSATIERGATCCRGYSDAAYSPGGVVVWPAVACGERLVGDGLPDQLGHVDDDVRSLVRVGRGSDLADADADDVVESPVRVAVAEMEDRAD